MGKIDWHKEVEKENLESINNRKFEKVYKTDGVVTHKKFEQQHKKSIFKNETK